MRLAAVTLLSVLLAATGCATGTNPGTPGKPGASSGPAQAPRPKALSGPETVGADELHALKLVRATSLRPQPAPAAKRYGAMKAGDMVLVLETRGRWYRVWVPSVSLAGWIEPGTASAGGAGDRAALAPVPVSELSPVTVSKVGARLRNGPSAGAEVVRPLEKGESLRLLSEDKGWVKVYDPDGRTIGFVAARLVEPVR